MSSIAQQNPQGIAIRELSRSITYQELEDQSHVFAQALHAAGILQGDRVAVSLGNCIEYGVVGYLTPYANGFLSLIPYRQIVYAVALVGAILVPLNPAYTPQQTIFALNHIAASCFVLSSHVSLPYKGHKSTAELLKMVTPHFPANEGAAAVPTLQKIVLLDNEHKLEWLHDCPLVTDFRTMSVATSHRAPPLPARCRSAHDVANIQFTSGTTNAPKPACLTHHNVLNNAYLVGLNMELQSTDVICCPPPLYHCFGLVLGLLAAMCHGEQYNTRHKAYMLTWLGATLLLPSESFDPGATIKAILDYGATALYGVPTMFLAELELVDKKYVFYHSCGLHFAKFRDLCACPNSVSFEPVSSAAVQYRRR